MGAFCLSRDFRWARGGRRRCFWFMRMGAGVESVRCDHGVAREHGRQMSLTSEAAGAGDIVFTHGEKLARFTSALAEEAAVAAPEGEYAGDVAEMPDGRWLLSARRPGAKNYGLAVWKPGTAGLTMLAEDAERELVEPVVVAPRAVPNRHPSALHDWAYGNLLALDARQSRNVAVAGTPVAVRAETMDGGGSVVSVGTAPVEKDGSFFVQAAGDRPLRFILLDAAGNTLRQEQGWFWVRRGEQRICVGCHTGPERAPENQRTGGAAADDDAGGSDGRGPGGFGADRRPLKCNCGWY